MSANHPHERELERLERLAMWFDTAFAIKGTGIRFGLDGLAGLVPGLGDGAAALPGLYIIMKARQFGVPGPTIARMILNMLIDLAAGTIPVIGDLFDVAFKSKTMNVALIRKHVESEHARRAEKAKVVGSSRVA